MQTDRPIDSASEDTLGRQPFVNALVQQIEAVPPDDSAVIALHGAWGSGKTSILNMTAEALKKEHLIVVRFNPWLFAGTEQLLQRFFAELANQLLDTKEKKLQAIAEALSRYSDFVAPLNVLPGVGAIIQVASSVARSAGDAATIFGHAPSGSAYQQRETLAQLLKAYDGRVVVLVDDIDRLVGEEIREVMRLIRLVADLPKTVYVLAFDRLRVAAALSHEGKADGQAYLEKIVQAAFDIPRTAPPDLVDFLEREIASKCGGIPGDSRTQGILKNVVYPLFSTVREARRYINALGMALAILRDEVAISDLLALEAVQTVHPEIIEFLAAAYYMPGRERDDAALNAIIEETPAHASALKAFVITLFSGYSQSFWGHQDEQRKLRYASEEEVFAVYLEKKPPKNVPPMRFVCEVMEAYSDRQALLRLLSPLSSEQLEAVIDRLADFEGASSIEAAQTAAIYFADLEGRLREGRRFFRDSEPYECICRLLKGLACASGKGSRRVEFFERVFPRLETLSGKHLVFALIEECREQGATERIGRLLASGAIAAPGEALLKQRHLNALVLLVARKHGVQAAERMLQEDAVFARFIRCALIDEIGSDGTRSYTLPWRNLCKVFPADALKQRILSLAGKVGFDDERTRIAFDVALKYVTGQGDESV
jgi:DNA-directed RNA polymerase specialized sigma24 family protein